MRRHTLKILMISVACVSVALLLMLLDVQGIARQAGPIWLWTREHVFTAGGGGVVVGAVAAIVGVTVPLYIFRRERLAKLQDIRHANERRLMLRRVRNKWAEQIDGRMIRDPDALPLEVRRWDIQHGDLHGSVSVRDVFDRHDGGLLILGEAGSGKTTTMLRLASELVERAESSANLPIPVILQLSSWGQRREPLERWLVTELAGSYGVPRLTASRWVEGGLILPLLDGLDEVDRPHRAECVQAINAFGLARGLVQFVVTSRTSAYTELGHHLDVAIVEVQPLARRHVREYLDTPLLRSVLHACEKNESLWELVRRPLVLNLLTVSARSGMLPSVRGPGSAEQFMTALLRSYLVGLLRHKPRDSPSRALRYTNWLARSMLERGATEFQLDRMDESWLPTVGQRRLCLVATALITGMLTFVLDASVYSLIYGVERGIANGLVLGAFIGLFAGLGLHVPTDHVGWSRMRFRKGARGGLILGLAIWGVSSSNDGLAVAVFFTVLFILFGGIVRTDPVEQVRWNWSRAFIGTLVGLPIGATLGLTYGFAYGLWGREQSVIAFAGVFALPLALFSGLMSGLVGEVVTERSYPNEGIVRSGRIALVIALLTGPSVGALTGLLLQNAVGLPNGLGEGIRDGVVLGFAVGFLTGGLSYVHHFTVRALMAARRYVPFRLGRFLDGLTDQLILVRVGSGYMFVHRLILQYAADAEPTSPLASEVDSPGKPRTTSHEDV